jgi:CO/xanthine dehydrogenase FAD-binding subunit
MIPASFDYHRPASVAEALSLVAKFGDEGRVVAGGHSLIPMMKLRMANPQHLIDLRDVAELKAGIRDDGGTTLIGALVTQAELIADESLARSCPILREAALQIADPQIRNCGTVGGNVANGVRKGPGPARPLTHGENIARKSTRETSGGFVMTSENREGRRAVFMHGAERHKATPPFPQFNPSSLEIFRQACPQSIEKFVIETVV